MKSSRFDFRSRYIAHVTKLTGADEADTTVAMQEAIGGKWEAIGQMELDLLVQLGLKKDEFLIDVGCGSGRLASPLSGYLTDGRYLGTDVVPDLLDHARRVVERPDWRFELCSEIVIPEADGAADMVCFFSVFTDLSAIEEVRHLPSRGASCAACRRKGRLLVPGVRRRLALGRLRAGSGGSRTPTAR